MDWSARVASRAAAVVLSAHGRGPEASLRGVRVRTPDLQMGGSACADGPEGAVCGGRVCGSGAARENVVGAYRFSLDNKLS